MISLALSFSVCVSECVMGSPYSPDLYSTSLKRYDLCNKQKRNQKTHLWNKQINRQIKKKVLQKAGVQTQVFKNLPRRSYQNVKIISQFVHIVTLNKISRSIISPPKNPQHSIFTFTPRYLQRMFVSSLLVPPCVNFFSGLPIKTRTGRGMSSFFSPYPFILLSST